jgi:hypothetical protein
VVPTVTAAVDPVVYLASAHRRVRGIVVVPGRIEADVIETTNLELPNTRPSAMAQVHARVGREWRWPRGALADLPDRYHLGSMLII